MKTPYQYQHEGVAALASFYNRGNHGAILADEPGVGKTAQALMMVQKWRPTSVAVVCPANLKLQWQDEIPEWVAPGYQVNVLSGRKAQPWTPGFPVIDIVNYDILGNLDFSKCEYDFVVYDEAHLMKTPEAKRTVAAASIPAHRRLLMTGTPIVNRPKEIWQLMVLCGLANPADFHKFGLKYCAARRDFAFRSVWSGPKGNRSRKVERVEEWNYDGASNLEEMNHWLYKMCMVRRRKAVVLPQLPAKTRRVIRIPRSGKSDLKLLAPLKKLALTGTGFEADVASLSDELKIAFEEISLVRHETALEKVSAAIKYIDDALQESPKVFVPAYHRDVLELLHAHFEEEGDRPALYIGGMSTRAKEDAKRKFIDDPRCRLLFGQYNAVGTGTDGLQKVCDRMVLVESPWDPGTLNQLEDRIHRGGQGNNVLIDHLVFEDSVDCKVIKTIVKKQKNLDAAIDGPASESIDWLSELTTTGEHNA